MLGKPRDQSQPLLEIWERQGDISKVRGRLPESWKEDQGIWILIAVLLDYFLISIRYCEKQAVLSEGEH